MSASHRAPASSRSARYRTVAIGAAAALIAAVGVTTSGPAKADTADPTDFAGLQAAVSAGGTVHLGGDIVGGATDQLVIPTAAPVILDLAGHHLSLSITDPSALNLAAVNVPAGATLTIADDSGAGTGRLDASGDPATLGGGAGIGGNAAQSSGTVVITGGTVSATGGLGAAGIGGGYGNGQGAGCGAVSVTGGTVTASGANYGAGIGGGATGGGCGTASFTGGTVTATGGLYATGIGPGSGYVRNAGAVTIGKDAHVTAANGAGSAYGTPSAIGQQNENESFGSLDNAGTLTIPAGATLLIPGGVTVTNSGTLTGAGTVVNNGAIANTGTIPGDGLGAGGNLLVTGHNFLATFDATGSPDQNPSSVRIYADSFSDAGLSLPAVAAPVGATFGGWYADANTVLVHDSDDLTQIVGNGPATAALVAAFQASQSIDFPPIADASYGDPDIVPAATATSGLPVSYSVDDNSAGVCEIDGNDVHLTGFGTCTVLADQAGDFTHAAAQEVSQSFSVNQETVPVVVDGSQDYEGAPSFTTSADLPSGLSLDGDVTCTSVDGGTAIDTSLAPDSSHSIDSGSCDGLQLDGDSAADYQLAYVGGTFTVGSSGPTIPVTITPDAQEKTYGQSDPDFTYKVDGLRDGISLDAEPTCSAPDESGAGTFDITCTGAQAPAGYSISYETALLTVDPATITVTPDSQKKTYGQADPAFTYSLGGLVDPDTSDSVFSAPPVCSAPGDGDVGIVDITCTSGHLNDIAGANYTVDDTASASIEVDQATITVIPDDESKAYGAAEPDFTYNASGFISPDKAE